MGTEFTVMDVLQELAAYDQLMKGMAGMRSDLRRVRDKLDAVGGGAKLRRPRAAVLRIAQELHRVDEVIDEALRIVKEENEAVRRRFCDQTIREEDLDAARADAEKAAKARKDAEAAHTVTFGPWDHVGGAWTGNATTGM